MKNSDQRRVMPFSKTLSPNWLIFILLLPVIFIISGCEDKPEVITKTNVTINLIIDNSASLAGYFSGRTEFKENISGLVSIFDKMLGDSIVFRANTDTALVTNLYVFRKLEIIFGSDSNFNFTGLTAPQFIDSMNNGITIRNSSNLDEVLTRMISKHSDKKSISVFISDGVYDDKTSDCDNKIATMRAKIASLFNIANNKNLSTVVYQFNSKFSGAYYTCSGNVIPIMQQRPYYIWFIGDSDYLIELVKRLEIIQNFKPVNKVYCGAKVKNINSELLSQTYLNGINALIPSDTGDPQIIAGKDAEANDPVTFSIGFDFSMLPSVLQSDTVMNRLFEVESKLITQARPAKIYSASNYKSKIDPNDVGALGKYTHFIEFAFSRILYDNEVSSFKVKLKNIIPQWVKTAATNNDNDIRGFGANKTFGLDQFIYGIYDAYSGKDDIFEQVFLITE